MKKLFALIYAILIVGTISSYGQCKIENTFFQAGETITMDLYFKYGIIYTKAGTSTLKMENANFNGTSAYKMSLTARTTGAAKTFYTVNDTLSAFMTKQLVPLQFEKRAHEGDDHTYETATYSYTGGKVNVKAKRIKNGNPRFDETISFSNCVYDMISVVYYARTLDYSNMKKGDSKKVEFITGKRKVSMSIEHDGIVKQDANDKKKYECIKLVLSILSPDEKAFENKEEAMTVYITNDKNRMPIRLDSKLKVGSTRAILKSYSGNKYPIATTK